MCNFFLGKYKKHHKITDINLHDEYFNKVV